MIKCVAQLTSFSGRPGIPFSGSAPTPPILVDVFDPVHSTPSRASGKLSAGSPSVSIIRRNWVAEAASNSSSPVQASNHVVALPTPSAAVVLVQTMAQCYRKAWSDRDCHPLSDVEPTAG